MLLRRIQTSGSENKNYRYNYFAASLFIQWSRADPMSEVYADALGTKKFGLEVCGLTVTGGIELLGARRCQPARSFLLVLDHKADMVDSLFWWSAISAPSSQRQKGYVHRAVGKIYRTVLSPLNDCH